MDRASGTCSGLRPPRRWRAARWAILTVGAVSSGLAGPTFATATPTPADSVAPASGPAATAWQVLALLVLLGGVATALRMWWLQRRTCGDLREARARLRCLDELLDVWQWQSDAEHRLVLVRPPHGAPPADWSANTTGVPL